MEERRGTSTTEESINEKSPKPKRNRRQKKSRSLHWSLRVLIPFVLVVAASFAGLVVGYSYVGDGAAGDAFSLSTFKHIYDLVFKMN